jgi:NAD(P)-dependent dehydrogenase (short-subunit alcohol dehydrogenase family)
MSTDQIVLVVGASRGLGLALIQELAATPNTKPIGTVRGTPTLKAVPNVQILTLDIADDASIEAAASSIPELDTLIINAGVGTRNPVTASSTADLEMYLDVNLLGPHRAIRAFLPALRARTTRRIVAISSSSSSLAQQALPGSRGLAGCYGVSKAALNMLVVQCHKELHKEGFTVVPIHPGWVATDMGNQHGR